MCKPPCCETSSGGGGLGVIAAGAGILIAAAIAYEVLVAVIHAVEIAIPYILATLGTIAVAGTVGTVWLAVRGSPPTPEPISETTRQRLGRPVPEIPASLTWTARVTAIGGKPVTVPANQVRQPTHAR